MEIPLDASVRIRLEEAIHRNRVSQRRIQAAQRLLDDALQEKQSSIRQVQAIVDEYPHVAAMVDVYGLGSTPLHEACGEDFHGSTVSPEVIEILVTSCPVAAAMETQSGSTPLSLACRSYTTSIPPNERVVHLLLQAFPEAARIAHRSSGCVPLHNACLSPISTTVIRQLLQYGPEAQLLMQDKERRMTPLQTLLWTYRDNERDPRPFELARTMVELCPESLLIQDHEGHTPLYIAANTWNEDDHPHRLQVVGVSQRKWGPHRSQLIRFLMTQYPESIRLPSHSTGVTPFYMACARGDTEMILEMMQLCPEAVHVLDAMGLSPLFQAVVHHPTVERLRPLFLEWPVATLIVARDDSQDFPWNRMRLEQRRRHSLNNHSTDVANEDADSSAALEFMWVATLETAVAFLECVLTRQSSMDPRLQSTLRRLLPFVCTHSDNNDGSNEQPTKVSSSGMGSNNNSGISGVGLLQDARIHLTERELCKFLYLPAVQDIVRSNVRCQQVIHGIVQLNRAGRDYILDDNKLHNRSAGVQVLASISDNMDAVFLHLCENPFLCQLQWPIHA